MAYEIKRNDLRPHFRVQLTQSDPDDSALQVPVDLTAASSVSFRMTNGTKTVSGAASVIDAPNGVVEYDWVAGNTDTAGTFTSEFEVLWGTEPQTFPSNGFFAITINPDLAA